MCFSILFYRMKLMCFAGHLNSLLLIFCSFISILSLLFLFCPYLILMSKRKHLIQKNLLFLKSDSNPKHFSFFVFDLNVSNKICSTWLLHFFYFKLFIQTKVSQNAFNFNQIDFYVYSIF